MNATKKQYLQIPSLKQSSSLTQFILNDDPDHYKIAVKDFIQLGASPRATIALTLAAKAYAFLKGRGYVTPQDVKSIGMDVLRHRVAITYEAEAEEKTSETVIQKIFDELPVP